jgi:glycosyltransferase involved in cell wall biosynthesis
MPEYGGGKMRVLLIAQQCQVRNEGQPKAMRLAEFPDIELKVLVPDRYYVEGKTLRHPDPPENPSYSYQVGKVFWPWTGPGQWYLHWYPGLASVLKSFRPDVIDLWEEPWGLVSVQTCFLRNLLLPNTRIISETEQNIEKKLPFPFEPFRRYTLRNADFVIGRNDEAVAITRRKGSRSPAAVVPNGVDIEVFRPMDREAARRALGFSGFVCGYVGRLVEQKGLEEIVEALKYCPPEVNVVFAGSGPFQADIERLVSTLGLQSRVRFLPSRSREELPEVMSALDVLLLPSRTTPRWKEQFGRVIIEAHACRTPVIGSDSGAIPRVTGEGGLIVPERDPAALAAAMRKLRENPAMLQEMGAAGRRQVEESYSWQKVAAQMRGIYMGLPPRSRIAGARMDMKEAAQ